MAGDEQADTQCLRFDSAMESRLTGQEGVGACANAILEKVIAGPASDGQTLDPPMRVTSHPHDGDSEGSGNLESKVFKRPRLEQPADAAGSGDEAPSGTRLVQGIHVDGWFFVRMARSDRRDHAGEPRRRADEFQS